MSELSGKRCIPCEGGVPPLTEVEALKLLKELDPEWMLVDGGRLLAKSFTFKDFKQTMAFVNKIAEIAEAEGHHPDMSVGYGALGVELMTHAIGGLSKNDFIVAAKIDEISNREKVQ